MCEKTNKTKRRLCHIVEQFKNLKNIVERGEIDTIAYKLMTAHFPGEEQTFIWKVAECGYNFYWNPLLTSPGEWNSNIQHFIHNHVKKRLKNEWWDFF